MLAGVVSLAEAGRLPRWRRPEACLVVMAAGMPFAFAVWMALLNNFVVEAAGFDGSDIGWVHTVREIPGFLAIAVLALLLILREQTVAILSLLLLGGAVAATGYFPSFWGICITTIIGSVGFHYYETINHSLQLQWLHRDKAPRVLGWIVSAGSAGSLIAFGTIVLTWKTFDLAYTAVYLAGGGATVLVALFVLFAYPRIESPVRQRAGPVLRRAYWLYYALVFMDGARRQIFVVFAAFMMVQRFGLEVHELTGLFLLNYIANMVVSPIVGRFIQRRGERLALNIEYSGLIVVFACYAIVGDPLWAAVLYVIDHLFFAMAFAQRTYFQKIADPADIAPSAAVSFTVNHIAAVFLPAALGYLYLVSPSAVFWLGVGIAAISLLLSLLVPRHPRRGRETILVSRQRATKRC